MKVTLQNTEKVVQINGRDARVWEGQTEGGVPCFALVVRIGCPIDANASEFERELLATDPVRPDLTAAIPTRLVL